MLTNITGVKRKFRSYYQRILIISILISCSIILFIYLNLEFCYKLISSATLDHMCKSYEVNDYSGALCDELCHGELFKDFKCPVKSMKTTLFTAAKNNDVYDIKMARHIKDDLTWYDRNGKQRFPELLHFQNIIKRFIIITYNVTIEDTVIHALLSQEIDPHNPQQMVNLWRLFKDNNYVMGKLYEEESIFPNILGSCGPYYATENLLSIEPEAAFKHYIAIDWEARLKFAMIILDYLYRLDSVKPEPLKMCKIEAHLFGMTLDKRIKYQTARYVQTEGQMDKIVSSGIHCTDDEDCKYENCVGLCDATDKICNGIQQNNNLQIVCQYIFKGTRFFPGLLNTSKTPHSLLNLLNICINPSNNKKNHYPNRIYAPTFSIGVKLYNEIKRVYNELTFQQ